ncbi:NmrA/HSCARG family protein [Nonomuraea sp. NPDC049158]|uniref:NmrA/HSCARG family protein n=1 Tax=Nonomuraea sp. NPDC049158 TaxID=3155649 RepID=UPI0033E9F205
MSDQNGPILVIGATGQQGSGAVRELLDRGRAVHAFVRDTDASAAKTLREAGAELIVGDLDDPASLRAAMRGVHGVFLVLTMLEGRKVTAGGIAAEARRGRSVVDIARESSVGHLVYSSVSGADRDTGIPYYANKLMIEQYIAEVAVPATILRPFFFMDNFTTLTRPVLGDGEVVLSLALRPETRLPLIATRDIGAFAAIAFEHPDRFLGRTLKIAGDELSAAEMAEAFGRVTGLPARFQQLPIEHVRAFDEQVAKSFEWFDQGAVQAPDFAELRAEHPGLMTLDSYLRTTGWRP